MIPQKQLLWNVSEVYLLEFTSWFLTNVFLLISIHICIRYLLIPIDISIYWKTTMKSEDLLFKDVPATKHTHIPAPCTVVSSFWLNDYSVFTLYHSELSHVILATIKFCFNWSHQLLYIFFSAFLVCLSIIDAKLCTRSVNLISYASFPSGPLRCLVWIWAATCIHPGIVVFLLYWPGDSVLNFAQ